ncbi:MAG: SCO family protein [Planctomycetota bacterium]
MLRRSHVYRCAVVLLVIAMACGVAVPVSAQAAIDPEYNAIREQAKVVQKLGATLPQDLDFLDHTGKPTKLRDIFDGDLPVVLTMVYLDCPQLCGLVLDSVSSAIAELKFNLGDEYELVTVSFDPRDTPEKAAAWRKVRLDGYGRENAEAWHFLTGSKENVQTLADTVGFGYVWVEDKMEFAHDAAVIIVSPTGVVTRYLPGLGTEPDQMKLALMEAADGKVGSIFDLAQFFCYRYDPVLGKYTPAAFVIMRIAGVLTVLGIVAMILLLRRGEKRRLKKAPSIHQSLVGT